MIKEYEFQVLTITLMNLKNDYKIVIIGDFNCDINRKNESDKIMIN